MKWVLNLMTVLVVLAALALVTYVIGALLPVTHIATIEASYAAPQQRVFDAVVDVRGAPAWRSGVDSVQVLSASDEPLLWKESTSMGTMTFRQEDSTPPTRFVARIDDTSQGFGGRWIYEVSRRGDGTVLRITEEGEVYSPMFRFMSRFIFGHYGTLEQYARDLGRHLGQDVSPERIAAASSLAP